MMRAVAALCLAVLASVAPARAEAPFAFETAPGRLPKAVRPIAYRIDLQPDLPGRRFTAHEAVEIEVGSPVGQLVLDATGLTVSGATLDGKDLPRQAIAIDAGGQQIVLRLEAQLGAGPHTLALDYAGPIPETPSGLYYNDYAGPAGRDRMIVTQFESTDARRMFPGWDEPAFKAKFQLTVEIPAELAAISNMPIRTETAAGTDRTGTPLKRVEFAETPRMSSYLLALAIGRLEARRGATAGGTPIAVWTQAGRADQGAYALGAAESLLPYYDEYFGVPYPLPKLDLIAVPGNFAAGAMENWGAITFIDNDLLYDPATSSPQTKEEVFEVVAHEMAHLWSGDLVTLGWWDNVWLNEGFADWMEIKATDRFNPDWQVWLRSRRSKETAMTTDAQRTTHALQQPISDESAVDNEFDEISYDKGAAVIRMVETWLGADTFRDGMRRYMKAHAYGNTSSADLWAALADASGQPVATVAGSFTEQPGLPLVTLKSRCVAGTTTVGLSQARFTVHDPNAAPLAWRIPVRLGLLGQAPVQILLGPDGGEVTLAGCGAVIGNEGDTGYYRVAYEPAALDALVGAFERLDVADRAVLVGDLWALVAAGRADPGVFLGLTRQLGDETALTVWTPVMGALETIDRLERGRPDRARFQVYAAGLLRPVLARLGWDAAPGESVQSGMLRARLIEVLGRFDDRDTIAEARRRFAGFEASPASLPPALGDAVLRTVARSADKAVYERLRTLGRSAASTELRLRYYEALAASRDPALIDETVALGRTDEVPPGRITMVLMSAAEQSDDPERVWRDLVGQAGPIFGRLLPEARIGLLAAVAEASDDPDLAAALRARPEAAADAGARLRTDQAEEAIATDIAFRARLLPAVTAWLDAQADR
jgi:aminopeptidase N